MQQITAKHFAERLVPEDQACLSRRRRTVLARDDFAIRAAHADIERTQQHARAVGVRFRQQVQLGGIGAPGQDGQRMHE